MAAWHVISVPLDRVMQVSNGSYCGDSLNADPISQLIDIWNNDHMVYLNIPDYQQGLLHHTRVLWDSCGVHFSLLNEISYLDAIYHIRNKYYFDDGTLKIFRLAQIWHNDRYFYQIILRRER